MPDRQSRLRFTADPDPRYCASAVRHPQQRRRPTHVVKIDGREFRVCASCARPWESVRTATVEKIQEVA